MTDWVPVPDERFLKVTLLPVWFHSSRWPWHVRTSAGMFDSLNQKRVGQGYGWKLKSGGMERFGGGWAVKLGIAGWGDSWIVDLIWGTIHVKFGWTRPTKSVRRETVS